MSLNEHLQSIGSTNSCSYNGDRDVTRESFVDPGSPSKQENNPHSTHRRAAVNCTQLTAVPQHSKSGSWLILHKNLASTQLSNADIQVLGHPTYKTLHNCSTVERRRSGSWSSNSQNLGNFTAFIRATKIDFSLYYVGHLFLNFTCLIFYYIRVFSIIIYTSSSGFHLTTYH